MITVDNLESVSPQVAKALDLLLDAKAELAKLVPSTIESDEDLFDLLDLRLVNELRTAVRAIEQYQREEGKRRTTEQEEEDWYYFM